MLFYKLGQVDLSYKVPLEQRPEGLWVAWGALNSKAIEQEGLCCAILGIARMF